MRRGHFWKKSAISLRRITASKTIERVVDAFWTYDWKIWLYPDEEATEVVAVPDEPASRETWLEVKEFASVGVTAEPKLERE